MKKKEYEFCLRCGRRLKNPEFRAIGYGKICFEKSKNRVKSRLFEHKKSC